MTVFVIGISISAAYCSKISASFCSPLLKSKRPAFSKSRAAARQDVALFSMRFLSCLSVAIGCAVLEAFVTSARIARNTGNLRTSFARRAVLSSVRRWTRYAGEDGAESGVVAVADITESE